MRYLIILFLALLMLFGGSAVASPENNAEITNSDGDVASVDVDIGNSDSSTQYAYCNSVYKESTTATTATACDNIVDCINLTATNFFGGQGGSEVSTHKLKLWSLERISNNSAQTQLLVRPFLYRAGSAPSPQL